VKKPIRVLIVEDSEFDARILVNTLRQGGYDPTFRRVETAESMRQALSEQPWEVVLSDYNLPAFSAPDALRVLQETGLDLPFVIVSGGIGEDIAVAAMKAGAHDYLMKGNLARLTPAVDREMREAATRRAVRQGEQALRESEERLRLLWENSTDAVILMEPDGTIRFANPAVAFVFGYDASTVVGKPLTGLLAEGSRADFPRWSAECLSRLHDAPAPQPIQAVGCHRQHKEVLLEIAFTHVVLGGKQHVVAFIRDVTQRTLAEEESRLLQGISLAVSTAPDLDSALSVVLRIVCQSSGWTLGQAWLPSGDNTVLECSPAWYGASDQLRAFREVSERTQFRRGEGLPGRVWQALQPEWVDNFPSVPTTPRAKPARDIGLVAAAGVPVVAEGELVAVIEFFIAERRDQDQRSVNLFAAIAAQLGVAMQQKRGEVELRANEEEFRAARDIQERLFPKAAPVIPGFDISGLSRAASAAGGDYFDYIPLQDARWGIAVGDVTGHGIGPALLMAETRAYLRALGQTHREVDSILTAANQMLVEDIGSERFITMLLVALDPATRILTHVNAGHPPAFVLDAQGRTRTRLAHSGVPLGIRPYTKYRPSPPTALESGDTVLLLTDGIEEAMTGNDAMFGVERALEVIRANPNRSAREMVQALFDAVHRFTNDSPQMDDATAVVIRVL
jgi:sigma-B regulation protein RsbU (phosphoserine phosphatase)